MKSQSSTGDRHGTRCKYLQFWFWLDSSNHFWNSPRYTDKAKQYFEKHIVEAARKEAEKKATSNGVIWSNKFK